ncbi:hypothetical protein O0881_08485 [Janthinobacterium sp. SUN100]|uniref:hypothetical protein n=1 Tax=Janthinobacterium sp. SUN100 TaxID=3004101 RepID=UPI0025B21835|nr:hypothetical protein [Janthinobacterium sp. SUN100]MDN2702029.1 hypothetical protein [Janthinobacterium sp. SUN100]
MFDALLKNLFRSVELFPGHRIGVAMALERAGNSTLPVILGSDYWRELLAVSVVAWVSSKIGGISSFSRRKRIGVAPMTLRLRNAIS